MRKRSTKVLLLALFLVNAAAGAADAPLRASRPAVESELTGLWKQIGVAAANPGKNLSDSWYSGVQYYQFPGGGKMKVLLMEGGETELTRSRLDAWGKIPASWSFNLSEHGTSVLTHKDRGPVYLVKLEMFVRDVDRANVEPEIVTKSAHLIPKKGDVALTYYGRDHHPVFFRLLRRYSPAK